MTEGLGWLTGAVLAVFMLDWLAVRYALRKFECILKPLAMLLLIGWTLSAAGGGFDLLLLLLVSAQVFDLVGDVFLLLRQRWFLLGLSAFLVGHLVYIALMSWYIYQAISQSGLPSGWIWWLAMVAVLLVAMLVLFYQLIAPKSPRLTMPLVLWTSIQVYGWILAGLVIASILVLITAKPISGLSLFLLLGALLFFISDSLLAYDRFKRKMPTVRVWIMITYHLAQFSLAIGFLTLLGQFRG